MVGLFSQFMNVRMIQPCRAGGSSNCPSRPIRPSRASDRDRAATRPCLPAWGRSKPVSRSLAPPFTSTHSTPGHTAQRTTLLLGTATIQRLQLVKFLDGCLRLASGVNYQQTLTVQVVLASGQPLSAVAPETDDSGLALPRKYARMRAANTTTNRKKPTTERVHGETGGTRMVRDSPALQRYLEEADLQRDRRVEAIEVPDTHKWGSEADMVPLVKAIMGVASESTDRAFVVCGRSSDTVPTAQGQVPSDDHCADIVCLYPHATTPETIEEWLRTDLERLIGEKRRRSRVSKPDGRRLDDVVVVGELKESERQANKAEVQLLRRFYRMTSTNPIQEWTMGFTICGIHLRVYVHMAAGIIRSDPIDCSTPAGFRCLKRFMLRILEDDLRSLGTISPASTLPVSILRRDLPPTSHSSNLGIGNVRFNSNLKLVHLHFVHPAMLGSRARVYTAKLRGRHSPTSHTAIISLIDEVGASRFKKIFAMVQAARFDNSYELPQLKHWLLNAAHFRTAPPMIGKGDAGCNFGPRAVQYVIYDKVYYSLETVTSTLGIVKFLRGALAGAKWLLERGILVRDLSEGSVMVASNGQGVVTRFDHAVLLDDPSAASELEECAGILAFAALGGYPMGSTRTSIVPHEIWHLVEQLAHTAQLIVWTRPGGEQHDQPGLSASAQDLLTQWNLENSVDAIASKIEHYSNLGDHSNVRIYPPAWPQLPQVFAVLSRYCDLGALSQSAEPLEWLNSRYLLTKKRWGKNGDLSLEKALGDLAELQARIEGNLVLKM
ncbi:BZ3500_MvSof-1268-A1-R1_Chr11-1g03168 [Microbotryum saponariae]|uniref:BZ3500_MvSof-1268-A1-R1_Chr11-1g03168 protein n=1 Tax=Microbotryum saponariae TaxID=289078 RepID=A0A2X0LDB1_9BASI|nr:BZ3501_MvSof-1269-A2-R1_Chr11g02743 [Microbotryum saponariae]SDA03728.1 BZ3500_MvSof-1268-A1-R1_Chr11-1g03168 [Microbotryum saponariae]